MCLKQYPFLTKHEFELAAKAFLKQSSRSSEVWKWVEHEKLKSYGYLSLKTLIKKNDNFNTSVMTNNVVDKIDVSIKVNYDKGHEGEEHENNGDEITEDDDPSVCKFITGTNFLIAEEYLTVDYHIIHSPVYQVPVLYFNAYRTDGTALTTSEIYINLVESSFRVNELQNSGFRGGLSQQDHPILMIPFYYLHPCETATLMKSIVFEEKNDDDDNNQGEMEGKRMIIPSLEGYIRSWLSFVGPVVGIKVSMDSFLPEEHETY